MNTVLLRLSNFERRKIINEYSVYSKMPSIR